MITHVKLLSRPVTTVAEATSLASLNAVGWRVVASRPTTVGSREWRYVPGIELRALGRLRDLGTIIFVQRRDGENFTLLAKVAEEQAKAWKNLLARELGRTKG